LFDYHFLLIAVWGFLIASGIYFFIKRMNLVATHDQDIPADIRDCAAVFNRYLLQVGHCKSEKLK